MAAENVAEVARFRPGASMRIEPAGDGDAAVRARFLEMRRHVLTAVLEDPRTAACLRPGARYSVRIIHAGKPHAFESQYLGTDGILQHLVRFTPPDELRVRELRRFIRAPVHLRPLTCALLDECGDPWQPVDAVVRDISGGGAGLLTRGLLGRGARLHLALELKDRRPPLALTATVLRVHPRGQLFMAGTVFRELRESDRDRIIRFCLLQQVEQRRRAMERAYHARR